MAAVSFAGTKSSNPTDRDLSDLYYVVEYLRATQEMGHILHTSTMTALRMYCEVDASYLLYPDAYTKKCKHFLMVLNYIKEQIAPGQIEARKIYGKLNYADMHTKPLRSSDFAHMAHKILGLPASTPSAHIVSPTLTG